MKIAAIVLAAGTSSRMGGENKLLADIGGKPLIAHVVDAAKEAGFEPVIVVLGHDADSIRIALNGHDVTYCTNRHFREGLSTSVREGVCALPRDIDGFVVCLGDMPRLEARHLEKLKDAFNACNCKKICVPQFKGQRGNPVLWPKSFAGEMDALSGDEGARSLINIYADKVEEVPMEDDAVLFDVDNAEALQTARSGATKST